MKRATTQNLISLLAATALIFVCALVTPPKALADAPPSARAPLLVRAKFNRARAHLTKMDRAIRDKEVDLTVYATLNPDGMDDENTSFEYDVAQTHVLLKKLRARRTELAAALSAAAARYNVGFADLRPSRGYASQR